MTTYTKIFHANLSLAEGHPEDTYYFFAGGKRYPLTLHDDESRSRAKAEAPHFAEIPDEALTHYTAEPVEISRVATTRVHFGRYDSDGIKIVHLAAMHVPESETETQPATNLPIEPIARITDNSFRFHPHHHTDWTATAKTFLLHHPDVMSQDPEVSRIINSYMDEPTMATYVNNLAQQMRELGPPGHNSGWARLAPMQIPSWGAKGSTNINYDQPVTGYQHNPVDEIKKTAGPALNLLLKVSKNDNRLKNKKWRQASGTSVVSENGDNAHAGEFIAMPSVLSADSWNAQLSLNSEFHGLKSSLTIADASKRQVTVSMENYFVRYLAGYIQFYDANGDSISNGNWQPDEKDWSYLFAGLNIEYDDFRFLGLMQPIFTILAIPDYNNPGNADYTFTFPENATSARLCGCGLAAQGSNDYPKASALASSFTGIFNLGIPGLMLAFAVGAHAYKVLYDSVEEAAEEEPNVFIELMKDIIKDTYMGSVEDVASSGQPDYKTFVKAVAETLMKAALEKVVIWIASQIATEEAAEEIPFVGWVLLAVNVAADIAQLAETIAETVTSPWIIENHISITAPCNVTVHPDPRHGAFPQGGSPAFTFKAIYKDKRPTITQHRDLSANFNDSTLAVEFTNHLGGQVKFEADFYLGDWLAAKATTGWMPNDLSHTSNVTLYLVQVPVPLTAKSVYKHQSRLFYENGTYEWHATSEPCQTTITSRNPDQNGYAIGDWNGLALSQRHGAIGWAWRAADTGLTSCSTGQGGVQLYALQNVSIPGEQMKALKFSRCGFIPPTNIVYDVYPAKFLMKDGCWVDKKGKPLSKNEKPVPDPHDVDFGGYFLDPRRASVAFSEGGGYHLRRIDNLENRDPLVGSGNLSYGRFPSYPNPDQNNNAQVQPPNSITLHPSGHVIGVNSETCKIYILELETKGKADKDVPAAVAFGGQATHDDRAGLLMSPIAVTCSYEGTILILEKLSGGGRIQAFDLRGNPVKCFAEESAFLSLPGGNRTYLDIAAVGGHQLAYIYVLYYEGSGNNVSDYHMEIYRYGKKVSGNNDLVGTEGVAAAKLAVDMWHTVYTLNFGPTTDLQGHNAGHTVPSISEWIPPIPNS